MTFISKVVLVLFYLVQLPFSAAGYIATWVAAFWFFGVSKANAHQDFMIALCDKRKQPGVE